MCSGVSGNLVKMEICLPPEKLAKVKVVAEWPTRKKATSWTSGEGGDTREDIRPPDDRGGTTLLGNPQGCMPVTPAVNRSPS